VDGAGEAVRRRGSARPVERRGKTGEAAGGAVWPAAGAGMGRGRRKETAPTGGPHLSAAEREGRWEAGRVGRNGDGPRLELDNEGGSWAGVAGLFCFFFKSFFKPISNILNSNLFHVFKLKF
jgi:hypothetical protein